MTHPAAGFTQLGDHEHAQPLRVGTKCRRCGAVAFASRLHWGSQVVWPHPCRGRKLVLVPNG